MAVLKLADGSQVIFESSAPAGTAFRGPGDEVSKSKAKLTQLAELGSKVLEESVEIIHKGLSAIKPDEFEIEIGLAVSHEGSLIVTKGTAEANLSIKAKWCLKSNAKK